MRPTFQAIREIEHATGMSAPRLLRQVMESDARVDHIARVVAIGVAAANGDDAPGYDQVGDILMRQGLNDALAPVLVFLGSVPLGERAKKLLAPRGTTKRKSPGGA